MLKNVVPGFVANHQERFIRAEPIQGRVPHYDALARAEAGHVCIDDAGLGARVHQEDS